MNIWPEGDRLIGVTYRWLAEKHQAAGSPLFATDECCCSLEDAVEQTYGTHDAAKMKAALKSFAGHMVEHFHAARTRRQEVPA